MCCKKSVQEKISLHANLRPVVPILFPLVPCVMLLVLLCNATDLDNILLYSKQDALNQQLNLSDPIV